MRSGKAKEFLPKEGYVIMDRRGKIVKSQTSRH
jgi:hypothetical protein